MDRENQYNHHSGIETHNSEILLPRVYPDLLEIVGLLQSETVLRTDTASKFGNLLIHKRFNEIQNLSRGDRLEVERAE